MAVQKGERLAGLQGFHPQRGAAELHRHGIDVDPKDAVLRHLTQGVLELFRGGLVVLGVQPGDLTGQGAGSR